MELTHFSDETTVPEVGKQRFVNVLDKVYGRSMLVIGNSCRPSSSEEQDVMQRCSSVPLGFSSVCGKQTNMMKSF